MRLKVAREVWGKHPDELAGAPFAPYMLVEMTSLAMIEAEDQETALKEIEDARR